MFLKLKAGPPPLLNISEKKPRPAYLPVSVLPSLSICRFERLHVIGSRVISPKYAFSAKAGARFGHLKSRVRSILKIAIYCPQGSGTLRQQLLMMH